MPNPNSPEARDIAYLLHAYTDAKKHSEVGPLIIEEGDGIYVIDNKGKRYIEAHAGLWSVGVGFSEPRLVEAATKQLRKLPFYHSFTHRSYAPLIDLAEKLVSLAPVPMSKAFFCNSGSEAIDTTLKLLWYRSNALGKPEKKKIITRARAYHGVTIAGSSLTGLGPNHKSFDLIVPGVIRLTTPHHYREGLPAESEAEFVERLATELEHRILEEGPETICAMFAEPMIGGGGVIPPPAGYWEKVQAILDKYDILLVADEVICGFGRTGRMFGTETFGMRPDAMVLSKQLSSSYMPISAILMNDRVLDPIAEESNRIGVLGHGFTAGGHPVAAAVAIENIRIIEERGLADNSAAMGERLRDGLCALKHPLVSEVRGAGLAVAAELVVDKATRKALPVAGQLGQLVGARMLELGVICRVIEDAIAFCPPMIITAAEIDEIVARFGRSLDLVLEHDMPAAG